MIGRYHAPFTEQGSHTVDADIADRLLRVALERGGDYADLFFEYSVSGSYVYDEQILKSARRAVSMGLGVRVMKGDATGYAYCSSNQQPSSNPTCDPRTSSRVFANWARCSTRAPRTREKRSSISSTMAFSSTHSKTGTIGPAGPSAEAPFSSLERQSPRRAPRALKSGQRYGLRGPDLNRRPSGYELTKAGFCTPSQHPRITEKHQA